MPKVRLSGCRPEPLLSYLKALGVLKAVGTQQDPEALGWWDSGGFVLESTLSEVDLVTFFSNDYRPTPILAPWNKDSGFYGHGTVIEHIEHSADDRLSEFRQAIATARQVLQHFGWSKEPGSRDAKAAFVAALRSCLPDSCLDGLDAIVALIRDELSWAPLFGAGGVDGRFEFTRRYAESVLAALGVASERSGRGGRTRPRRTNAGSPAPGIRMALFAEAEPGAAVEGTGGLWAPGSVDAPNASQGFMGKKQLNPWDFVLAMEGAVLLAGSVSRRFAAQTSHAAFPFAVQASAAGYVGAGEEESKGEIWLPLWSKPVTAREVKQLFREGRAEWAGRPATAAADMARSIVSLGVDRGIREFRRYGIQERSGKSYLAVPVGSWPVVARPEAMLLADLDEFLDQLRGMASRRDTSAAVVGALRRLEAAILGYAAHGGRDRLLKILEAASSAELALARRPSARPRGSPRPLRGVRPEWVLALDDGSVEFELAVAVASLKPSARGPGYFRRHLEPVVLREGRWNWSDSVCHEVVWSGRNVLSDMAAVLERRLQDAAREEAEPALDGWVRARPEAVTALVEGELDFDRLARLCEALALVNWDGVAGGFRLAERPRRARGTPLTATYAVLKLAFLGRRLRVGETEVDVRADQTTLGLLRAGDVWRATLRAARRLRASGLTVRGIPQEGVPAPILPDPELGRRLLAALLVPVWEGPLIRHVLYEDEETPKEGGP